jgi:trehalose/maltose hydrolase-like predicted phosphorylase
MRHLSRIIRLWLLPLTLIGCSPRHSSTPSAPRPAAPPDPWLITTTTPGAAYRPTYLGNGLLGQVMDAGGLGMTGGSPETATSPAAASGAASHLLPGPQPATLAGFYDNGRLVPLPPLFPLAVERDGQRFGAEPANLTDFSQTLDMRRGLLTTRARWNGAPVEITAFLSRDDPALAVCRVVAPREIQIREALQEIPISGALKSVPTHDAPTVRRWATSQSRQVLARAGRLLPSDGVVPQGTAASTLVSAIVSQPAGTSQDPVDAAARTFVSALKLAQGRDGVFPALLQRHTRAMEKLWASDIEIEGHPADQQLVRALLFQVTASVRAGTGPGFPPMGLSNPAAFDGHVFWDADTWVFPALLPLHPEFARTILDYRYRTLPGAKANAAAEGKPGASYAWESADTGREVATLETRHGRHVSADIALAYWQYYLATGDRAWLRHRAWPVLSSTADYWAARAVKGAQGRWEIRQVSTPDENAGLVDNSAWTNFSARENLRSAACVAHLLGLPANPRWTQVAEGLLIPRDRSGMIQEYSGYQGRPAKQTDTLLLLFPGDMPLPRAEQERMFRRYVDRTIKSGPAMTESVHAVIAARLGQPEEAYRRFRASVDPFVRPPFHSFSEKRTRDHMQFLTGAAGSLQAVLYGFAGLRLRDSPKPVFEPHLPPGWTGLTLRSFHWRGRQYDVFIKRGQPARVTPR